MRRLTIWIAALALLIGLGWWYGTPYLLRTAMGHPVDAKQDAADIDWTCNYRGLQGMRVVGRIKGGCARVRLFQWDNTCGAPGMKAPDDPSTPLRVC